MPSKVSSMESTRQTSWKMHFVVIFQMFVFWGFHGSHFWFHFWFHFVIIFLPNNKNDPKMKLKMSQKWPENGYREQPYSTTIPPICDDREQAGYLIPINHSFFATELPVEDIQHLTLVTVPPKGVVANLVENSKQQWLDDAESIRVPDEPPLPLWVCLSPMLIHNTEQSQH